MSAKPHTWIGDDHPPGWRRVGSIDLADPADLERASRNGWRKGTPYHGGSDSFVEPCAADVYEREVGK